MDDVRLPTWFWRAGRGLFLATVLIAFLIPIVWTTLASLNLQPDNSVSPPIWPLSASLDSYSEVRAQQTFFWPELGTSIAISVLVTALTALVSIPAAYGLSRIHFRGRRTLIYGLLILGSLPAISYAIPLGLSMRQWRLFDSVTGIVLAESAGLAPLTTFILIGYVAEIPIDLEAEARLNGAGLSDVLLNVIFPGIAPGLAATSALVFVLSWNQFVVPLVLSGIHIRVVPVMLRDFFALDREFVWPEAAAVIIISLLPVSAFVIAVHRILDHFSLTTASELD